MYKSVKIGQIKNESEKEQMKKNLNFGIFLLVLYLFYNILFVCEQKIKLKTEC